MSIFGSWQGAAYHYVQGSANTISESKQVRRIQQNKHYGDPGNLSIAPGGLTMNASSASARA